MRSMLTPFALLALSAPAASQEAQGAGVVEAPEVPTRLLSDCAALAGGEEFDVGLHLELPPGWHVYWSNPGDRGRRTSVALEAPPGFRVEGPLYPGPRRIEQAGGLVSYAYLGETVILFRVIAPRRLPSGPLVFRAQASWMATGEASFTGEARPELRLERGDRTRISSSEDVRLLARFRARLPRPLKEAGRLDERWRLASEDTGEGARVALELGLDGAEQLEFFPALSEELYVTAHSFDRSDEAGLLTLECEWLPERERSSPRLRGVLRVVRGLEWSYFDVDLTGRLGGLGF